MHLLFGDHLGLHLVKGKDIPKAAGLVVLGNHQPDFLAQFQPARYQTGHFSPRFPGGGLAANDLPDILVFNGGKMPNPAGLLGAALHLQVFQKRYSRPETSRKNVSQGSSLKVSQARSKDREPFQTQSVLAGR